MVLLNWIDSLYEWGMLIVSKSWSRIRIFLTQILTVVSIFIVTLWLSVFLYACFTFTYMPSVAHEKEVFLGFSSKCEDFQEGLLCDFPHANISLVKEGQTEFLSRGQSYVVTLDVELPESPENVQHGMFMVGLKFYSRFGEVVRESSRSTLLRYKSFLHRIMETFVFSPTLLIGTTEQKQTLVIPMFESYQEDPYRPSIGVLIEIQSRRLQIYRTSLRIHASFTGLRYLLYYWPITSAIFGISFNMMFISLIMMVAYYNLQTSDSSTDTVRTLADDSLEDDDVNGEDDGIVLMSSSSKLKGKSQLDTQAEVQFELDTTETEQAAEDLSFTVVPSNGTGEPEINITPPSPGPSTGTDASDLRYRKHKA